MFKKIGKYSIIEWVIKRLKVKSIDRIILATSKKYRKLKIISKTKYRLFCWK